MKSIQSEVKDGYAHTRNGAPDIQALTFWTGDMKERAYISAQSQHTGNDLTKCGFVIDLESALRFFAAVLREMGYTVIPPIPKSDSTEKQLLNAAFAYHKGHGAIYGMNFVECWRCLFHVHSHGCPPADGEPAYLIKHWGKEYDREPIVSIDDPRLKGDPQ